MSHPNQHPHAECVLTVDWGCVDQTAHEALALNGIPPEILAEIAIDYIANGGAFELDDRAYANLHETTYYAIENIAEADETDDAPIASGNPDQINHLVTQVMGSVSRLVTGFYPQVSHALRPSSTGEYPVVLQEAVGHNGYRIQAEYLPETPVPVSTAPWPTAPHHLNNAPVVEAPAQTGIEAAALLAMG